MTNKEKLKEVLLDVFMLEDDEFSFELKREDVDSWDSLGVVSMAVGIHEEFGYHFTPDEAMSLASVNDIINLLEQKNISFE